MFVCVYVCVCMFVCVYVCVREMCVGLRVWVCVSVSVCVCVGGGEGGGEEETCAQVYAVIFQLSIVHAKLFTMHGKDSWNSSDVANYNVVLMPRCCAA